MSIYSISAVCLKSTACFCFETDNCLKQRQCFPVSFSSKRNCPLMLLRAMERSCRKKVLFSYWDLVYNISDWPVKIKLQAINFLTYSPVGNENSYSKMGMFLLSCHKFSCLLLVFFMGWYLWIDDLLLSVFLKEKIKNLQFPCISRRQSLENIYSCTYANPELHER